MINGQKEIWISTGNNSCNSIIAISNCGRKMYKNGKVEFSNLRDNTNYYGKKVTIYRLLAQFFIRKTEEDIMLHRDCIDHITHYPTNYNINDIRNLRWCTKSENNNFDERRKDLSKVKKGKTSPHKHNFTSYFGQKFFEHYGLTMCDDTKLYLKERAWYNRHKKLRWE